MFGYFSNTCTTSLKYAFLPICKSRGQISSYFHSIFYTRIAFLCFAFITKHLTKTIVVYMLTDLFRARTITSCLCNSICNIEQYYKTARILVCIIPLFHYGNKFKVKSFIVNALDHQK